MSNDKSKAPNVKAPGGKPVPGKGAAAPSPGAPASSPAPTAKGGPFAKTAAPGKTAAAATPVVRVMPLFRQTDWLTFLITFGVVWVGYYLTLAPELTLEDSGELATGSYYAGIPHPPGYPVWTIYTWLWTVLVPVKSVAWRVALGEATGGALAAGLLGLLVSRGSSLLIEGIEELKAMAGRWENAICMISGFVAGMLIGFNGFMWSQCVIVEVYAFSVASFMAVLLCLMRWIYAPHQRRFLYLALFFHGVCFTNHMTLIVAAMGLEVAIAAASYRMGRTLFLGNSIIFLGGLILKAEHILTALEQNQAVFVIFIVVGVCSIAAYFWFSILTRETFSEFCLDVCLTIFLLSLPAALGQGPVFLLLALLGLAGLIKFAFDTHRLGLEWLVIIACGGCWLLGAAFYFYMPLAGMSNPPMEWGYPRTVEGFFHAFTRGQYEKTNPSDIIHHPGVFLTQLGMLATGIVEEFNWVYMFLALVPFLFFFKMHRRERAWLIGIGAIYLCLGVLLLILLNPPPDRAAQELVRVFFTASHTLIALLVGYGLTLIAAYMATHYLRFRSWGLIGGAVAVALAIFSFTQLTQDTFFGQGSSVSLSALLSFTVRTFTHKDQYGLPVYAGLILIGMTVVYLVGLLVYRHRAPLAITLFLFALMPLHSILTHWSDNEEHEHWFGYWFGHDMFTPPFKGADGKPLYPSMTKDAVLFGGTDPGRFCPTYMIFCDSFTPQDCLPAEDQNFDRRDVYIITQNALADNTYLCYIRAQYDRSTQIDPPFFQELLRSDKERVDNYTTNLLARAVAPLDSFFTSLGEHIEKRRRAGTSFFTDKDFLDLPALAARLRSGPQQDPLSKYLADNLSPETRQLLAPNADQKLLRQRLARDLNLLLERELEVKRLIAKKTAENSELQQELEAGSNSARKRQRQVTLEKEIADLARIGPLYEPTRFKQVQLSEYLTDFIRQNPQSHTRIRLNRLLLEAAYPKEIAKSIGGLYPDREIYTPSVEDSQRCFQDYLTDAQRRLQHDAQLPNEPRQIKPGEDVKIIENRVQVSGQIAVMSINGLLTKVIFEHNPKNEFFVEESFPLDWMYPYLTPFGIIMKINRQPLAELTEDIYKRDHEFWKQYSRRLTGDIIDYDTPVKQIAEWVEKTYLRRDFSGFQGDRKFIRDDQGQKAFSKLRSSIGGIYAWRVANSRPGSPEQQRALKEADFALRQAFAFCPFSPEAVFRYVNLLLSMNRLEDALLVASTCLKLDPYNGAVIDLVNRLKTFEKQTAELNRTQQNNLQQFEKAVQDNPSNIQALLNLASTYAQMQRTTDALQILDRVVSDPHAAPGALRAVIQAYASLGNAPKIQAVVQKLEAEVRTNPANFEATVGLAEGYRQLQQPDRANQALDAALAQTNADAGALVLVAQEYGQLGNYPKIETALERLVKVAPESPEAWYDLAALKASLGKTPEVLPALRRAVDLSALRLKLNPRAPDLLGTAQNDPRFAALRQTPEFQQLLAPHQ